MKNLFSRNIDHRRRQKGAVTMFSAVLILILLTEMVIFAVHTGVFEQRKSSNDMRQKLAFHMADAGIQQAKQFFQSNAILVASWEADLLPKVDSSGDVITPLEYHPGWLQEGRWTLCSGNYSTADYTHPCWAEPVALIRNNMYFYSYDGAAELPASLGSFDDSVNRKVTLYALLCMLEINLGNSAGPPVSGCTTTQADQDVRYFMVSLLARGEADCDNSGNNCKALALIADKLGSYGPGGGEGGPDVPLTARTNVPLSGTVNIVPNPNGGGVGVPISTWANARTDGACKLAPGEEPVSPESGSFETCEAEDWYGVNKLPEDLKCPTANCFCKDSEDDRLLSYASGNDKHLGIDIVPDPDFPCDLFLYTFGIPKSKYMDVFNTIPSKNQLTDCSSLNAASAGPYWVSGDACDLPNEQVGSKNAPVFLISATKYLTANAKSELFGVLFVTDAEYADKGYDTECAAANARCGFKGTGGATIYGAAVMDAKMDHFRGNYSVVYVDTVIRLAIDTGAFGSVSGGWTDFHENWR